MNPNKQSFKARMSSFLQEMISPVSYYEWINQNTTLQGAPFNCDRYPFQKDILNDMSAELCCIKPSQVGLTEIQLRKALAFVARNPYRNLIYTMPDKDMRKRVYQNRMLPILTSDEVFQEKRPDGKNPTRSIETTEIGTSQMLMFPANEKAATSQPADVVFHDEIDLADPAILALFDSRLQGSDLKIAHSYSTPTFDGIGIAAQYAISNKKEYLFKCPHCGKYQAPRFTTEFIVVPNLPIEADSDLSNFDPTWVDKYNINLDKTVSICCKCKKPVTYGDAENHEWVAQESHRSMQGYKVTPFNTRNLDAAYIMKSLMRYLQRDNMKGFKNTVLGETHESTDERLPESLLRVLFTNEVNFNYDKEYDHDSHFIGVDMGNVCHITISKAESLTRVKYVLFETVKKEQLLDRISFLRTRMNIVGGHIDRLPLIDTAQAVRDMTDYTIVPIQYVDSGVMLTQKNDEYGVFDYLAANRTMHLDLFANALKAGKMSFSGYGSQKETIINQLRAMARVYVENTSGSDKIPVWKKLDRQDHYFHSMAYNYQAVNQYFSGYAYDTNNGQDNRSVIMLAGFDTSLFNHDSSFNFLGK